MKNRKSTRAFTDKKVSIDDLKEIIKLAQMSPSWVNSQPVRVDIATGNTLEIIRKEHGEINQNPNLHTKSDISFVSAKDWDIDSQNNMKIKGELDIENVGEKVKELKSEQGNKLFNAPAVVYLTLPDGYNEWSLYDTGSFAETIILAAKEKGIDSIPAFEFVKYADKLREHLNVNGRKFIIGIGLGYQDDSHPINQIYGNRMPLEDVLNIHE
ncbi:nitroreductase [Lactobacillus sp. S2-2]|uniref:nitroreductase family protein n=1 Tax=Lactobacillus sp. S2-2 TaxID=2692917 RepID=UPI001F32D63E|nr:nitroreductase family protein [Lactobacillus sp. S2-2]MCF6514608.1 nitroreductase [Lactobacillus sp. S2-2]